MGLEDLGKTTDLRPEPRLQVTRPRFSFASSCGWLCLGGHRSQADPPPATPGFQASLSSLNRRPYFLPLQEPASCRKVAREGMAERAGVGPPDSVVGQQCHVRETLCPQVPHFPYPALQVCWGAAW